MALVVVVLGTICAYLLNFQEMGINLVGEIPSGLPDLSVPEWNWTDVVALLPAALALSLIGFMEAMSISKGVEDSAEDYKVVPNQELIAIGMSNVVGSFFSSVVVTAGFSRTAVNYESGAKTGLARLISAVVILFTLLFLTGIFYYLPEVLLAAIILVAVVKLIDIQAPVLWWKTEKREFLMYIATFLGTLFIGIQEGITIGIGISLFLLIYRATVPHLAEIGRIPGQKHIYRNVKRFDSVEIYPKILIVRFDESLFYANVDYFRDKLLEFEQARSEPIDTIIIDGSGINSIDLTGITELRKMILSYHRRGIRMLFAGLKGPVRDSFDKHKIFATSGDDHFFVDVENAVNYCKGRDFEASGKIARQSNLVK